MFIGFVDGDGYFDIGSQKQTNKKTKIPAESTIRIRLSISLHNRDLALLNYFVKTLGVGKITPNVKREQVRVLFYKNELITVILPLIKEYNLKFLTYQRAEQFSKLNFILDNSIIH